MLFRIVLSSHMTSYAGLNSEPCQWLSDNLSSDAAVQSSEHEIKYNKRVGGGSCVRLPKRSLACNDKARTPLRKTSNLKEGLIGSAPMRSTRRMAFLTVKRQPQLLMRLQRMRTTSLRVTKRKTKTTMTFQTTMR